MWPVVELANSRDAIVASAAASRFSDDRIARRETTGEKSAITRHHAPRAVAFGIPVARRSSSQRQRHDVLLSPIYTPSHKKVRENDLKRMFA
ncbi:hypothetical protein RB195_004780 [Necator americanus]|uniref:Uncharacterized protein n=1 Tax=Necator americanus TaxID=51031 RepID=A0ABR1BP02_NECAM